MNEYSFHQHRYSKTVKSGTASTGQRYRERVSVEWRDLDLDLDPNLDADPDSSLDSDVDS